LGCLLSQARRPAISGTFQGTKAALQKRHKKLCLGLAPGFGNHEDTAKKRRSKKRGAGVVGIAWYREAASLASRMPIPAADQVHESYAQWLKFAEESMKRRAHTGMTVEPFIIDIDDFLG
jgi:hypothetical protein